MVRSLRNGNTLDALKQTKQKVEGYQLEFLERLNAIEVDAHWFRRVFHTFGASFLFYYILPDTLLSNLGKIWLAVFLVIGMMVVEYRRLKGVFDHQRFFGLRNYEKNRPASYMYFGVAMLILLLFFPQQIAIPCILCASFTDPIIGESRYYLGKKKAYVIGFLVSLFFFLVTWYRADITILLSVSVIGASAALIGEAKKLRFLDDDFMIQMLPAVILALIWLGLLSFGVNILPPKMIVPL